MPDCCIIGGGIVGLSIARELAGRGATVRVVARDQDRSTSSWAAAGIFPPAPRHAGETPGETLTGWSDELHRLWARDLLDETGIDNGLVTCGGLHVAGDAARLTALDAIGASWRDRNARCELLTAAGAMEVEPGLADAVRRGVIVGGIYLPEETQIRTPRHLEAVRRSCENRGVAIMDGSDVTAIRVTDGQINGIEVTTAAGNRETVQADAYCLAAGAWSGGLAAQLDLALETKPVRGQIALLRFPRPILTRVINMGVDYLLPRPDGRLLVGSTLEDAGFDGSTTAAAIDRLRTVATTLLGDISAASLEQVWAGLRPGSSDGLPSIGRLPGCHNGFVAAGHFRAGLHQSTGTAVLIADLITGKEPTIDLAAFAPDRPRTTRDPLMPP
ncbi:MAG: FAD-dependent oxidoreductase [Planctomycetota bacterium]|nr:FAD-dependent oxidoreductase [Planctomycetota bacterium]